MKWRGTILGLPMLTVAIAMIFYASGCATPPPRVDSRITSAVESHHVSSVTVTKIQRSEMLDYSDIVHLVRAKVPASIIIAYLQSTDRIYQFSPGQLDSLRRMGGSSQLVNYLNETRGFYADGYMCPTPQLNRKTLRKLRRTGHSPTTIIQSPGDVIDPAYEESLFSPFR